MGRKKEKSKDRVSKFYFWMFIIFTTLAVFMFWSVRRIADGEADVTNTTTLVAGIMSSLFGIFFGLLCFRRFLRKKSIAGGLFLTMSVSTACFLLTSLMLRTILPPAVMAFGTDPEAAVMGERVVLMFAQIGLFALWFGLLLYTIYIYVKPVRRIERYLHRINSGERIKTVRIGKAQQYRSIEEQLRRISDQVHQFQSRKPECSPMVTFIEDDKPPASVVN